MVSGENSQDVEQSTDNPVEKKVETSKRNRLRARYKCSFCDKEQIEVGRLIAGPKKVYICDECVRLCNEIINDEDEELTELTGENAVQEAIMTSEVMVSAASAMNALAQMLLLAPSNRDFFPEELTDQLCNAMLYAVNQIPLKLGERIAQAVPD